MTSRGSWIWTSVVPLALASLFALHSFRDAGNGAPVNPDAARHALNGALLHDMVRDGGLTRPVEYAGRYYSRLPATSIPYHPPMFPAIEAVAFWLLGVRYETARLVVALTVFGSALLLYRLVLETHRSHVLAAAAVGMFLAIPDAQWLSQDVMLEFPSLLFVLAALLYLQRTASRPSSSKDWLFFAGLSGAAIWTKQHDAFLVAVPLAWLVLGGRWRELKGAPLWLASASSAGIGLAMLLVSRYARAGWNQSWSRRAMHEIVRHHVEFYSHVLSHQLGWIVTGLVVIAAVAYGVRKARGRAEPANDFYWAWGLAAVGLILVLPPREERYLLNGYPPLLVLGLSTLHDVLAARVSTWVRTAVLAAVALILAAPNLAKPPQFVQGYHEAARAVNGIRRVLYCGPWDGSFIFAMRVADPRQDTRVIREDKVRPIARRPADMDRFLHGYGVGAVVVEDSGEAGGCEALRALSAERLVLQTEFAIVSSDPTRRGRLLVYRFVDPSPAPVGILRLPSGILREGIEVDIR